MLRKSLIVFFIGLLPLFIKAQTTYYVAANGSDANAGTSQAAPWQTLSKVNGFAFTPGDQILFRSGDTFNGTLTVSTSGTSTNPIFYGSYGTGAKPVITGLQSVTAWTSVGTNLWQSTSAVTSLSQLHMVIINGKVTPMGRTPNAGTWYHYGSASTNKELISTDMPTTPNWAGAEMVVHIQQWEYDRCTINSQSGDTLNYTNQYPSDTSSTMISGNGFFIQNDVRTLDQQNEWYFDPSTKKLEIYSTTSPTNVQVATLNHVFYDSLKDYITVKGISFSGAEGDAVYFTHDNNTCIVRGNEVSFSAGNGILLTYGSNITVDSNYVHHVANFGITGGGNNLSINADTTTDIGLWQGLTTSATFDGISTSTNSGTITGNVAKRVGGNGVRASWTGGRLIQYNFVDSTDMNTNDHSGIAIPGDTTHREVSYNIALHPIGYNEDKTTGLMGEAIYLDDAAKNKYIHNNIGAYSNDLNFKLHGGHYDTLTNNLSFAGKNGLGVTQDGTPTGEDHLIITGNISVALAGQYSGYYRVETGYTLTGIGLIDSNYYANQNDSSSILTAMNYSPTYYSLYGWQNATGHDTHGHIEPQAYTDTTVILVYNPTWKDSTVSLSAKYQDVKGIHYDSGHIVLHKFEGAVLFKTGSLSVAAPTVTMSGNQSITIDSTSVYATATWAAGHTGGSPAYSWTQISGPNTATIRTPLASSTEVVGLTTGLNSDTYTYDFRCTVKQDDGQTAYGDVIITVTINTGGSISNTKIVHRKHLYR